MRRLLASSLILLTLTASFSALAQSNRYLVAFIAVRMLNNVKTSGDITDFIVASKMPDSTKQELFKKAEGDFNRYKDLEQEWAKELFDIGAKQVAYFEMLKYHYLRDLKRGQPRQYFNTTSREYFDKVQEEEMRVLKKQLDERLGIVKAREIFGNWLKEQNYPHAQEDTPTDIYFRWYDAMKARLKAEMQMQEVQEYEIAMAVKMNYGNLDPRPMDVWDFNKRAQTLIDEHLEGKYLSQQELDELNAKHPELLVMVKDIKRLSLAGSKLSDLQNNEQTQEKLTAAREELSKSLNAKGVEGLIKYVLMAGQMFKKYGSQEELTNLATNALNRFMETGNFNDFMIGRIYKLAATFNSEQDAEAVADQLRKKVKSMLENISNFETTESVFEEVIYKNALATMTDKSEMVAEAASLIAWVSKFEAKKIALRDQPIMLIERYEYKSFEGQKRIQDFMKMTKLQNGLKRFREKEVRELSYYTEIRNFDRSYSSGEGVYEFIVGKN